MNQDDVKALAARQRSRAHSIAKAGRVAAPAEAAKPAAPGPVPLLERRLRVLDGGKAGEVLPPLKSAPVASPGRMRVSETAVATAKARGKRYEPAPQAAAPFSAYQPSPGVLPERRKIAQDSVLPGVAWANHAFIEGSFFEGMEFLGYPYLARLMQRTEYRRGIERLATEMTRKWIKLTSTGDDDKTEKIKQLDNRLKELSVKEAFAKLAVLDGGFGRAHLFIDTGDNDDPKELRTPIGDGRNRFTKAKIKKGTLKRLQVIEPVWCYPAKYNADDPIRPDWYKPETWFCMGKEIHHSRLLPFVGREVPDLLKPSYAFGGLSLTQMLKPYVDNWLDTRQSIARLIGRFSTSGIKTDLQAQLSPDPSGAGGSSEDFFRRMDLFLAMAKNEGLLVIDKNTEDFFQQNVPLGTLDQLQAQAAEQMCMAVGLPVVVFLGLTPHGLNASADNEIRAFEDWVMAYQPHFFGDRVQRVIDFAMIDLWGAVDEEIGFEWVPLHSLDEKAQAEVDKIEADIDNGYVDHGVLDPIEVRKRIAAKPGSGYNGIDVEDVPEPPDEGTGEGGDGDDPFGGGAPENDNEASAGNNTKLSKLAGDEAKVSKESVGYSEGKAKDRCRNCEHFQPNGKQPGSCEIVSGAIDPSYWCERFHADDR